MNNREPLKLIIYLMLNSPSVCIVPIQIILESHNICPMIRLLFLPMEEESVISIWWSPLDSEMTPLLSKISKKPSKTLNTPFSPIKTPCPGNRMFINISDSHIPLPTDMLISVFLLILLEEKWEPIISSYLNKSGTGIWDMENYPLFIHLQLLMPMKDFVKI